MKDRGVEVIDPEGHITSRTRLGSFVEEVRATIGTRVQVVTLSPVLAAKLVHESWQLFHCVVRGKRLNRQFVLQPDEPSVHVVTEFVRGIVGNGKPGGSTTAIQRSAYNPGHASQMHDVRLILQWLDVSIHLKNHRDGATVASKLASIWTRKGAETKEAMMARLERTGAEIIRKARVRLDVVCMILHRCLIEKLFLMDADLSVYMFIDSSPQRRGMEMFAVSVDLVWGDRYERRLWPVITLEHHMLDKIGKSCAL